MTAKDINELLYLKIIGDGYAITISIPDSVLMRFSQMKEIGDRWMFSLPSGVFEPKEIIYYEGYELNDPFLRKARYFKVQGDPEDLDKLVELHGIYGVE